ncbi:hypothetical protein KIN20_002502 [Parelaphostrongylus tenuis]|uniref:Aminopeptidase N-like N-terminal domain-containing protein n=1 Tax=Parelaphostrongylus tenuis TaxID=148309 RepID=A0AAD5LZX1_PARTN|nr:hypothetical protein KIN20_002502 [Parelaphostrongylus tenuis]
MANFITIDEKRVSRLPAQVSEEYPQLLDISSSSDLLPKHNYSLILEYRVKINNQKFAGVFSAPYRHGSKPLLTYNHKRLAVSFPCIDSPEAKARFDAVVIHPKGTYALFNTKEANITTNGETPSKMYDSDSTRFPLVIHMLFVLLAK